MLARAVIVKLAWSGRRVLQLGSCFFIIWYLRAAAKIIRAVERDKRRVLVGVDAHIGVLLKRLFPVGFQRLITLAFRARSKRR